MNPVLLFSLDPPVTKNQIWNTKFHCFYYCCCCNSKKDETTWLLLFSNCNNKNPNKEIWFVVFSHLLIQRNKHLYLNFHLGEPLCLDHTCIKLPILMSQVKSRVWLQSILENQRHFDKNNKCQKHLDFRRLLPIFSRTSFLKQKSRFWTKIKFWINISILCKIRI